MNKRDLSKPAFAICINDQWDFNSLDGLYQIFTQVSLDPGDPEEQYRPDPHRFGRVERDDVCYAMYYRPEKTELTIIFIEPGEARREYKITPHSIVRRKLVNDRIYRKEWKTFFTRPGSSESATEWNVVYDEEPRHMRYLLNGKLPTTWADFTDELVKAADYLFRTHHNPVTYGAVCTAEKARDRFSVLGAIDDNALAILLPLAPVSIPSLFRKGGAEVNNEAYRDGFKRLFIAIDDAASVSPGEPNRSESLMTQVLRLGEFFEMSHMHHIRSNNSVQALLDFTRLIEKETKK